MTSMRTLALLVLLGLTATATASPVVGQSVIYRYDSTHSYAAVVAYVEGDGSADLVILNGNAYSFGFGPSSWYTYPSTYLAGVTEGAGDNRWSANPNIGLGATGPGALVSSTGTPSFSLNGSAVQLDAAHDTELTVSVSISLPLSLVAGATGTVHLICDSSSTPTTEVETLQRANAGGLATTDTSTLALLYRVPAAHYCKITTTQDVGSPTFAIVRQVKQTLGN